MSDYHFDLYVAKKLQLKAEDARKRGLDFKLTYTSMRNLMKAKRCYYTGLPLTMPRPGEEPSASDRTIDRVDSNKGYVPGNVVACCHAFNEMKSKIEKAGVPGMVMVQKAFGKAIRRMEKV